MLSLPQNMFDLSLHHHSAVLKVIHLTTRGQKKKLCPYGFSNTVTGRVTLICIYSREVKPPGKPRGLCECPRSSWWLAGKDMGKDALNPLYFTPKGLQTREQTNDQDHKRECLIFSRTRDRLQETEPIEIRHHHPLLPCLIPGTKYKLVEP